jgi:glycerol dehydrogenase-like iron-containing ADH family enzyme
VKGLRLVALTRGAGADEVAHQPTIMVDDEVLAEALQRLLNAGMTGSMASWSTSGSSAEEAGT